MVTTSKNGRIGTKMAQIPCFSLLFMVTSRDRIAPNCLIRHPVRPIVALQRQVRFSAPLARFCRIRRHQRRPRRAERASFSGFVSNRDFRVPRLRQRGKRALTRPNGSGKEATRKAQNRCRGYRGVAGLASSGPVAARASLMSIFLQARIQSFAQERGILFLDVVSLRDGGTRSSAVTSPP